MLTERALESFKQFVETNIAYAKENGMVEKKEEVSGCTGKCDNCPNYAESYFCGFATPYCKLQGKEITHNVY